MARIYSIIRRKQFNNSNIVKQNELQIDFLEKSVSINNELISLIKKEFDLLIYFIGNKNKVISNSTLKRNFTMRVATST